MAVKEDRAALFFSLSKNLTLLLDSQKKQERDYVLLSALVLVRLCKQRSLVPVPYCHTVILHIP